MERKKTESPAGGVTERQYMESVWQVPWPVVITKASLVGFEEFLSVIALAASVRNVGGLPRTHG